MTVEAADVVISGAGPNGLMLACELALAGVRSVVLDKLPGPSDEPKVTRGRRGPPTAGCSRGCR